MQFIFIKTNVCGVHWEIDDTDVITLKLSMHKIFLRYSNSIFALSLSLRNVDLRMCSRFASGFAFIRERYQIAIINRAERRFTMITVVIVITAGLWINVTNDFPSLLVSETFIWVYHRFTLNRLDIYAFSLIIFPSIKFPRHKRFLLVRFFARYESIYYFFWQFFFTTMVPPERAFLPSKEGRANLCRVFPKRHIVI